MKNFKESLCYVLNKKISIIYKIKKIISGFGITIASFGITIPEIKDDINHIINKTLSKNENITLIIDDLERKSEKISYDEILGFISWLNDIDNLNIIIISDTSKIIEEQNNQENSFIKFKEKVIDKTYKIIENDNDAITKICNNLYYKKERKILEKSYKNMKLHNLRTLEKSIKFLNNFIKKIKNINLTENDIERIFNLTLILINEEKEDKNIKINKEEKEDKNINKDECKDKFLNEILTKYHISQIDFYDKTILLGILYYIVFEDREESYEAFIHHFKTKEKVRKETVEKKQEKNLFYCSKEELLDRANRYNEKYINKIADDYTIIDFIKDISEFQYYLDKTNIKNYFNDDKVEMAINNYIEKINYTEEYEYKFFTMSHNYYSDYIKKKEYDIKNKINNKRLEIVKKILKESNELKKDDIELYFNLLKRDITDNFFDEIKEIFLVFPNVDGSITDKDWGIAHYICDEFKKNIILYDDNNLIEQIEKALLKLGEEYSEMGKYRINSLIKQYINPKFEY